MGEVTQQLRQLGAGDRTVLDRLIPNLYSELRRLAHSRLRAEWAPRTLATTELVHEAYLRLVMQRSLAVADSGQFFAAAAQTMRRVLVDAARSRRRLKRGGGPAARVPLEEVEPFLSDGEAGEMLVLDAALQRLAELDHRAAQVVHHRYFAGLSLEESAQLLGVSTKTVQRDWLAARAWLRREMTTPAAAATAGPQATERRPSTAR